ncbi:MAG: amino acid adenylation domain-containing protein [Roseburia sp.]|nr:amino acid adenylation domain-containing protein [Ruminococcus sp.]MCM1153970.1 amino acid adenylation domain-containing protein [Roseburia sp.]MCM1242272.1 amino acid adenylation domain-containing protein [Roseburia sp.]
MKANVTYWLDETAQRVPDKTAFADEKKEVSFRELQRQAKAIATQIIDRGLFKKPVVIYLEKGVEVLVSFMGAAYSNNFYSPIDIDMPASRVNKILEVLDPALVITTAALKETFAKYDYRGDFLLLEEACTGDVAEEKIDRARARGVDTDLLYVLFTSGSTGIPKGVTITHRSVIDYIDWVTETFAITQEDSFGNQAPFYFDNSILDIYSTIRTGATTYIIPKNLFAQPVPLLEYIKEKKINTIFWVPSALIVVAKLKAFRNVDLTDTLKRVLFCGEVMPNKQLNVWRRFLPEVLYANLYGPTEITDACTYYIVDREFSDDEPLPIGIPMANTDILILNEKDEPVTGDEIGELCVRGTSLSMGYYHNPEKTKEAFVQNPLNPFVPEIIYRTGDLVKYNEYGEIIYLSRKDFQIKHMGHRIELGEIETAVSSLEEISLCCCLYDEKHQKIVLFIEQELEKAYINEQIARLVPEYMLPNKVITLEKMPINANGKIDRVKLKELIAG